MTLYRSGDIRLWESTIRGGGPPAKVCGGRLGGAGDTDEVTLGIAEMADDQFTILFRSEYAGSPKLLRPNQGSLDLWDADIEKKIGGQPGAAADAAGIPALLGVGYGGMKPYSPGSEIAPAMLTPVSNVQPNNCPKNARSAAGSSPITS